MPSFCTYLPSLKLRPVHNVVPQVSCIQFLYSVHVHVGASQEIHPQRHMEPPIRVCQHN